MNKFVFVVCGAREHIDTLNYSLEALRKYAQSEIIVLTDSRRNDVAIEHENIVDVPTPDYLDHHQASIYLKTSIHRHLTKGHKYCYLDTDVVALSSDIEQIFEQYIPPIIFAKDHCSIDKFSPAAVHCGCIEQFAAWEKELKGLFKKYKHLERQLEDPEKKQRLEQKLEDIKKDKLMYKWITFRFWLSPNKFNLDNEFFLDKKGEVWVDKNDNAVLYENEDSAITRIEAETDFRCNIDKGHLWTIHGKEVFDCKCDHLRQQINQTFGIEIKENAWHHWNGGVFLFDEKSHDFLEAWHKKTMQIFELDEWKTRDQGTLIATVHEFALDKHPNLSPEFNLIADYEHDQIEYLGNLTFRLLDQEKTVKPNFIHVYHHWGDDKWEVWQDIEKHTGIYLNPERNYFNALWIGESLSKLELLTIYSFLEKGHTFRLWVYDQLKTPLPDGVILEDARQIIPESQVFSYKNANKYGHGKGSYAGFSDIFRYKLLYERGGWWVDMDLTCLKEIYTEKAYFFRPHHELLMVGNIMKCPKGSELMKQCYDEAIEQVDENNTDWHKPIQILNDNIEKLHLQKYISKKVSNHDKWEETSKYIWTDAKLPEDCLFIHWQNEEWRFKNVSKTDFYYRSALAKLLKSYALLEIPNDKWRLFKNDLKYHRWIRKLSGKV
ncbi:MAG: glycosyltransferase [Chitinophagales bacterium]